MLSIYISLFVSAFLSATLLPGSSEILLAALAAAHPNHVSELLSVATCGNTGGATLNWALGRWLFHHLDAGWVPVSQKRLAQASQIIRSYGTWTLLFSWVPIIGDPLTFIAGVLHVPLPLFVVLVAVGKAARYLLVLYGVQFLS